MVSTSPVDRDREPVSIGPDDGQRVRDVAEGILAGLEREQSVGIDLDAPGRRRTAVDACAASAAASGSATWPAGEYS